VKKYKKTPLCWGVYLAARSVRGAGIKFLRKKKDQGVDPYAPKGLNKKRKFPLKDPQDN